MILVENILAELGSRNDDKR